MYARITGDDRSNDVLALAEYADKLARRRDRAAKKAG
jgi:hypothetical protein